MAACVIEQRWTIEATEDRFHIDATMVRKWSDRFSLNAERPAFPAASDPKAQAWCVVVRLGPLGAPE